MVMTRRLEQCRCRRFIDTHTYLACLSQQRRRRPHVLGSPIRPPEQSHVQGAWGRGDAAFGKSHRRGTRGGQCGQRKGAVTLSCPDILQRRTADAGNVDNRQFCREGVPERAQGSETRATSSRVISSLGGRLLAIIIHSSQYILQSSCQLGSERVCGSKSESVGHAGSDVVIKMTLENDELRKIAH